MYHRIHQTPNDIMADNSDKTLSAIERTGENNNRKLEEIKSASLITNNHLRKVVKNLDMSGVEMIRGKKGEVGPVGSKGDKGGKGDRGDKGDTGLRGEVGPTGKSIKGDKGDTGDKGDKGDGGKNGSSDTPNQVVDKVNSAKKKIDPKQVRGLLEALNVVDQFGSNPQGAYASGGANQMRIQDEGVSVNDHITALNFIGAGVSATYSGGGVIAVTITGTTTNFTDNETPTGTINGTNKVFTLAGTPSPAGSLSVYLNGALQQAGGGDFTLVGDTITFVNAPLTSSILLVWYRT